MRIRKTIGTAALIGAVLAVLIGCGSVAEQKATMPGPGRRFGAAAGRYWKLPWPVSSWAPAL